MHNRTDSLTSGPQGYASRSSGNTPYWNWCHSLWALLTVERIGKPACSVNKKHSCLRLLHKAYSQISFVIFDE